VTGQPNTNAMVKYGNYKEDFLRLSNGAASFNVQIEMAFLISCWVVTMSHHQINITKRTG